MSSVEQKKQSELEEKEREIAERVMLATVEQIRRKFDQDMETLKSKVRGRAEIAMEAAKDAKYLAQRQATLGARY